MRWGLNLVLFWFVLVVVIGNVLPFHSPYYGGVASRQNAPVREKTQGTSTRLSNYVGSQPLSKSQTHPHYMPLSISFANKQTSSSHPSPIYNEQLGTTFTQNFVSIAYNVTAVAQSDANGYGPGYLLNGLTTSGYWYQVGVGYDWPGTIGFQPLFEVFDSSGNPVSYGPPTFSGPVNSGDLIQLNLFFSSGNVLMLAQDTQTGAYALSNYSAEGANTFTGSQFSTSNSNGFFTGLMTEWYHASAYYGNEGAVTYSDFSFALSSAWMWVDEWNFTSGRQVLFFDSTLLPVGYTSSPNQFQSFSSHGVSQFGNAYVYLTGQPSCGMTVATVALSANTLVCNGLSPSTIGLTWGQSGYLFLSKYQVQESTVGPNGPWTTIDTITSKSDTTDYVRNLSPSDTYWWQIVDVDCCGATATTNLLEVSQPSVAKLSDTALTDAVYKFNWNNNANYVGPVAFESYVLMESMDQNLYRTVANLTSEPATNFNVTISPSASYSFYLATTDQCNGCSARALSSSNSNVISLGGPPTFVGGLFGEYWNASFFGTALSGCITYSSPVSPSIPSLGTSTDPQVNFGTSTAWNWHPFGYGNEFSVKWIGGIMITTNGTYSFQLVSDDGSWLYLDSALLINHGGEHIPSDSPGIASLFLSTGLHQIEIDYYETCGPPSGITLSWTTPGTTDFVLVPSNVLVAPPRLDGQGVYSGNCASTRGCQLLSTSNAQYVVLLIANCEGNCTSVTPSVTDSSGLAFSLRRTYCYSGAVLGSCLWEYYSVANSPLFDDNITSLPNSPLYSVRWRVMTLAVSGANTNSIFDPLLPSGQQCSASNGSPADCTMSFVTSPTSAPAPYEFLLVTSALNDADQCQSPSSQGWSLPIFFDGDQEADYQIAPLSQISYSFTCTVSGDPLIILADGIQGRAPDFAITGSPSTIKVDAGIVGTSTIALTSLDAFAGQVGLTISSFSGSLGCSLSAASIPLMSTASSTLFCRGSAGIYNVTITASGDGRSHSNTVVFQIMDFAIAATPVSLTVPVGSNSTSTVSLTSLEGYSGNIVLTTFVANATTIPVIGGGGGHALTMSPMPCGLSVGLSSSHLFLGQNQTGQAVLIVTASACVIPGIYIITIGAADFGLVHSVQLTVTVPGSNVSQPTGSIVSSSSRTSNLSQLANLGSSLPLLSWVSILLGPFGLIFLGYARLNRLPPRKRSSATSRHVALRGQAFLRDPVVVIFLRH